MKLLREPLLQFFVLGAMIFVVYEFAQQGKEREESLRIEIDTTTIQLLVDNWTRRWQRPPTSAELEGIVEARVREEVLYRQALALGLDTDDMVVRQRMVQKMEILSEDLSSMVEPSDQELREWWKERPDDYLNPPQMSFTHVYFNLDQRGARAEEDAERILSELRAMEPAPTQAAERGDRFMLGSEYVRYTPSQVRREYGAEFTEAIFALEPGWHGPILSGYGLHLVCVVEHIEAREPEFAEVRSRLLMDYNRARREEVRDQLYDTLKQRYEITVDQEAIERIPLSNPQPR